MRFARLVLPILMFTVASCTSATPLLATATAPAATVTPVPTLAPPTVTEVPPTATPTELGQAPSPAPTGTAAATEGGPTATVGPTATATPDPALTVIYAYLAARAKADVQGVTALACDAFDSQAITEAISFRSMNATLNDDLECAVSGADGPYTLVACTGTMTTTYGPDTRVWDLSSFVYQALSEGGAWTMCGYN